MPYHARGVGLCAPVQLGEPRIVSPALAVAVIAIVVEAVVACGLPLWYARLAVCTVKEQADRDRGSVSVSISEYDIKEQARTKVVAALAYNRARRSDEGLDRRAKGSLVVGTRWDCIAVAGLIAAAFHGPVEDARTLILKIWVRRGR